jgi:hypothetical protein
MSARARYSFSFYPIPQRLKREAALGRGESEKLPAERKATAGARDSTSENLKITPGFPTSHRVGN